MNYRITSLLLILICIIFQGYAQTTRHEMLFDEGWKFNLGDIEGAEKPSYNDRSWRDIDLPHDWSMENIPGQESGKVVGPFSREILGKTPDRNGQQRLLHLHLLM